MKLSPQTTNIVRAGIAASSLLGATNARANGERLLVFVHTSIKQRAFQGLLSANLPGLEITTVGRVADFERSLGQGQDAVLTLPMVMAANGMSPQVRGQRNGSSVEAYSLVGVGRAPEPDAVSSSGTLDILERRGTTEFVRGLLNSRVKVERVTKVEDLLPLLQFERVESILLPTRLLGEVRSQSSLKLEGRDIGQKLPLPALASVGPRGAAAVAAAQRISGQVAQLLGVDSWK